MMLSWWKCSYCQLFNFTKNNQCQACFNTKDKFSPLEQIMDVQQLLFDGFIRTKILSNLRDHQLTKIIPTDVLHLCMEFYKLDIISFMHKHIQSSQFSLPMHKMQQNALFAIGGEANGNREFFIALEILKILVKINNKESDYYTALGLVQHQFGIADSAYDSLTTAINLRPTKAEHRYHYGIVLKVDTDYENALYQFKKAAELAPNNSQYTHECALAAEKSHHDNAADTYYLKTLELDPGNFKIYTNYGRFLCKNMRDFEKSRIYYKKAISLVPDNCAPYYSFAKVLRNHMRDYKEAEKQFLKCLELNHAGFAINSSYGFLLYLMGDIEKAMEYVKIQMEIDNQRKWPHLYEGVLHNTLRNDEMAKLSMLKAVEFTNKKSSYSFMTTELQVLKLLDSANVVYYQQFEELLHAKFKVKK